MNLVSEVIDVNMNNHWKEKSIYFDNAHYV